MEARCELMGYTLVPRSGLHRRDHPSSAIDQEVLQESLIPHTPLLCDREAAVTACTHQDINFRSRHTNCRSRVST